MPSTTSSPPGALRPRVECAPPSVDTLGGLAADLAASAGLHLEPWQVDGLKVMLAIRADGKWAAFEYGELCPRQNGKTAMFMARALVGFLLLGEPLVVWSAHEFKTAMRAFRDLRRLIRTLGTVVSDVLVEIDGIPVKINNSAGHEGFERLDTGAELKMVARSKGSGRGFSTDCMIVDEAFAYTEEHQDALMPTLSARPNPQILYASSPPLDGATGGPLYALRARAEAGGDETLAWRDWGSGVVLDDLMAMDLDARKQVLDDVMLWAGHNPAFGLGRVTEESILRLRRSLTERGFAREIAGMWPRQVDAEGAWRVIKKTDWTARGQGDPDAWGERAAFAIAAPEAQDWAAIDVAGYARDSSEILVQVVRYARGTDWVIDEALGLARRNPSAVWAIDPRGPAGHLIAPLERAAEDAKVPLEIVEPSQLEVAHGAQRFVRGIADVPVVRHFDQEELDIAVKVADTRLIGDVRTWLRRGGTDISPLDAASLAVWAAEDCAGGGTPMAVPAARDAVIGTGDLMGVGF